MIARLARLKASGILIRGIKNRARRAHRVEWYAVPKNAMGPALSTLTTGPEGKIACLQGFMSNLLGKRKAGI